MKRIAYFIASVVSIGVVLIGLNVARAVLPLPVQTGPYLGDYTVGFYTLANAIGSDNQLAYSIVTNISTTSGQANCTNIGNSPTPGQVPAPAAILLATTLTSATGYVCLPTAFAGREIYILNNTGQTIDFYSNATGVVSTVDTINNVAGTTAYAVSTIGANANSGVVNCISLPGQGAAAGGTAPTSTTGLTGGAWACQTGH